MFINYMNYTWLFVIIEVVDYNIGGDMSRYNVLIQTLQKIKRSEERLQILIENKEKLEVKVKQRKTELDKENYDVQKLEGLSLVGFVHLIKGTLFDKLDKEEREAMAAKNKYDFACEELDFCIKEIKTYSDRVKDKYKIQREYDEYLRNKENDLIKLDTLTSNNIKRLTGKMYYNNEVIREIEEAIEAGDYLHNSFVNIINCFEEASDIGITDVLGCGLIVSESCNSRVSETNKNIVLIQQLIRKFHIELMDVCNIYDFEIDEEILSFSDYFLDGVISADDKVDFAKQKLIVTKDVVDESLVNLNESKEKVISENNSIKKEKVEIIENYLEKMEANI